MSGRLVRRFVFGSLMALVLAQSALAEAQNEPSKRRLSKYEQETVDEVIANRNLTVDPSPQGKLVEAVDIVPLEVFEKRDPVPGFVNVFHATSKEYVIRRQVLQEPGKPYDQGLVDDTARNLRNLAQISLVLCVPVVGSAPGRIRLVVITKDVWSLRLGWDFVAGQFGVQELLVEPTESNLGGTQQVVLARFHYLPESYSLGASFFSPRVEGRWLTLGGEANVVVNRRSGRPEGSYGSVGTSRPLFSRSTEWAWGTSMSWRNQVLRRYVNAQLATYDASSTPQKDGIPYEYSVRQLIETAAITRSWGDRQKNDLSFGAEVNLRSYRDTDDLSAYDPGAVQQFFRSVIPVSDTRVGPFVQLRHYENRFADVHDVDTLSLEENYRLGLDAWARAYPISSALGSSRDLIGTYGALQYGEALGTGFVRASVELMNEFQFGSSKSDDHVSDASLAGSLRIVSPSFGFGRLVFDASAYNRYDNYLNQHVYLGGDSRLRGYPTQFLFGKDFVVSNLEFRSKGVELLGCALGGTLFYDAGSAFDGFDHIKPYDSAGFGLRALFPQLERTVFRLDVGFPLVRPLPVAGPGEGAITPVTILIAFRQAFPLDTVGALPGSVPQAVDGSGQTYSASVSQPAGTPTTLGVLGQ